MAAFIPDRVIDEVLERVDIVEVISGYFPLRRAGRNFKALCPFHREKTPSFMVSPDKQIFHCFGCGMGGNVFNFIMKYERVEFPEAVKELAQRTGVELPSYSHRTEQSSLRLEIYRANELLSRYYHQVLLKQESAKHAQNYFARRGLSSREIIKFRLGFAPALLKELLNFASQHQIKTETLKMAGVILRREDGTTVNRFRNRVIFPIFNTKAKVIGFGGRVLDESQPKYINSPDTEAYSKGSELYGLNFALDEIRRRDYVVIVEGYLDLIACHQYGIENTVACLGTALTEEQVRLLKRYSRNVIIIYDGDRAGELATLRGLDLLIQDSLNVKIVSLPSGFDPDDYIRKQGRDMLKRKIAEADDLFDYKLTLLTTKFNQKDSLGKVKIIEEMLPTISKIENSVLRSEYIRKLSENLLVREDALWIELDKTAKKMWRTLNPFSLSATHTSNMNIRPAEKIILGLILDEGGDILEEVKSRLRSEEFRSPQIVKLLNYVYELDFHRKEDKPLGKLISHLNNDTELINLITEIVTNNEKIIDKRKTLNDCIVWIKEDNRKQRLASLQSQIKSYQCAGDEGGVARLVSEYNDLIRGRN
jgi:DNA primase